jgi:hypothetical protein
VDALVTAAPADTATSIIVPAGMTFTTGDPLSSLETLTVAGDLTLSAATLTRLETLTVSGGLTLSTAATALNNVTALEVSGSITANTATYDQVTGLVVSSTFNAGAVNFNNLQSLTVKSDGAFTTTGTIGPTAVTDPPGIIVEITGTDTISGTTTVSVSGVNIQATDAWATGNTKLVIINVAPAADTKLSKELYRNNMILWSCYFLVA